MALPILAFGFASPWLLGGLALGAVPVVIHLLHKRRYREVPWAAMRFLLEATKKNARRLRLEQLVLLVVRVAILVLLALALAQPHVESLGAYFQADAPTHRILVVDATYSMGHQTAETSRLERAKELARQVVARSSQGDALNLVRVASLSPHAVVREPAYQKSQVLGEIDALRLTDEPADLVASLGAAAELLNKVPDVPRKEVCIVSDFQAVDWAGPRQGELRRLLGVLSDKARVRLMSVASGEASNAAVVDLFAEEAFLTTGAEVSVRAVVRNYGLSPLSELLVELHADGRLVSTSRLDVAPGEEVPVGFTLSFDGAGEHWVESRIASDALPLDNRRWLSLPVRDDLNVLLVNGRRTGRESESASYYLGKVLDPSTPSREWAGAIRPREISDGELASTDLSQYDCVFLCDVALVTEREAELLRAYAESGGGLVICLGDQARLDNYNEVLYRDGQGLLPARLEGRQGNAKAAEEAFQFDPGDLRHPIVSRYKGNANAGLENTLALEYVRVTLPEESRAAVALRFGTGDPAIVDAPLGRGRVIVFTTSVDNRWGPWPLQASFPPIVHETVRHAVSGRWSERQRRVGEPIVRTLPTRAFSVPVTVARPDGEEHALETGDVGGAAGFTYEPTDRSGIYEVRLGAPLARTELYAVNVAPAEGDLAALDERTLRTEALPEVEFDYGMPSPASGARSAAAAAEYGGLTRWLLWAVASLVFVELVMAWQFRYGCFLLYGIAAASLAGQLWVTSAAGAVLVGAFSAAGLLAVVLLLRGRALSRPA